MCTLISYSVESGWLEACCNPTLAMLCCACTILHKPSYIAYVAQQWMSRIKINSQWSQLWHLFPYVILVRFNSDRHKMCFDMHLKVILGFGFFHVLWCGGKGFWELFRFYIQLTESQQSIPKLRIKNLFQNITRLFWSGQNGVSITKDIRQKLGTF